MQLAGQLGVVAGSDCPESDSDRKHFSNGSKKQEKIIFREGEKYLVLSNSNSKFLLLKPLGFNRLMIGGWWH